MALPGGNNGHTGPGNTEGLGAYLKYLYTSHSQYEKQAV